MGLFTKAKKFVKKEYDKAYSPKFSKFRTERTKMKTAEVSAQVGLETQRGKLRKLKSTGGSGGMGNVLNYLAGPPSSPKTSTKVTYTTPKRKKKKKSSSRVRTRTVYVERERPPGLNLL